ncbi:hypothetical protein ABDD95_19700 [Mucilaginibacter sp. PAMB04274]|uniref:ATP-binding protein n=1 Tax=Mucilaginibacter sp. PAMB04274 TaxID=3138568 RepID=UPI0031F674C8
MNEQHFDFDNRAEGISAFSHLVLDHLVTQLVECHHDSSLLFKVKFILGELLNNAVKHSGTSKSVFSLEVHKEHLIITKTDNGQPLPYFTAIASKPNEPLLISYDSIHSLYAVFKNEKVEFYNTEIDNSDIYINTLSEHMGLLIITKAASEFTYSYRQPANIFTVKLNLG